MTKTELISEERKFTFMLDDTDLTRKKMAEISIFNDGSVYCKKIIRTPEEDKKEGAYSYKSIKEGLTGETGDKVTHFLLTSLINRGLIK